MVHFISRCAGIRDAGVAGSAHYRCSHSNPAMKRVPAHIFPTARTSRRSHFNPATKRVPARIYSTARPPRFPNSNSVVQTIATRIYSMGRAFLAAHRMIKSRMSRIPETPLLWTYFNVEEREGRAKIERIVYPFLFRVTGKDILPDQKVYLLGMHHRFKEADYPPGVFALIKSCTLLLSEFPAQMANPKGILDDGINILLNIHNKLLSVDKEWIGTFLSAYEAAGGNLDIDILIPVLKEKNRKIKTDQACWLDRIPLADQTKIQTLLDELGLQLRALDPLSVFICLVSIKGFRASNYDFNTGELVILNNFRKRNCSIIELESTLGRSAPGSPKHVRLQA